MMPENEPSSQVVKGKYQYPDGIIGTRFEDYEMGGVALQNPFQGLLVQPWYGFWEPESGIIFLRANITGEPIPVYTKSNVREFSFTFDQNMRYQISTVLEDDTLEFYWYDPIELDYVVLSVPDVKSARLALDDKRPVQVQRGLSDVILTYITTSGDLVFRQQRDRYEIVYPLSEDVPQSMRITNFGMAHNWRLQWRLQHTT